MGEFPAEWVEVAARALAEVAGGTVFTSPAYAGARWNGQRDMYRADALAVLTALFAADAVVTPPGQRATVGDVPPCRYVSTACQHGLHERCRLNCKFCAARCACPRHEDDTAVCGASGDDRQGRAEMLRDMAETIRRHADIYREAAAANRERAAARGRSAVVLAARAQRDQSYVSGLYAAAADCDEQADRTESPTRPAGSAAEPPGDPRARVRQGGPAQGRSGRESDPRGAAG